MGRSTSRPAHLEPSGPRTSSSLVISLVVAVWLVEHRTDVLHLCSGWRMTCGLEESKREQRVRDRTVELAATNETLQQERHTLHTLMDYLPHNIYFKDADSRFIRVNKAMARYIGLSDPNEGDRQDRPRLLHRRTWPPGDGRRGRKSSARGKASSPRLKRRPGPTAARLGPPRRSCRCWTMKNISSAHSAFRRTSPCRCRTPGPARGEGDGRGGQPLPKSTFLANAGHEIRTPLERSDQRRPNWSSRASSVPSSANTSPPSAIRARRCSR